MKKLTILLITFFLIYVIYGLFKDNKYNYVNITDINIIDNYINKDKLANYNIFTSLSINDAIKDIRNNKTYAHDNPILDQFESEFIYKQVVNILYFIDLVDDNFNIKERVK